MNGQLKWRFDASTFKLLGRGLITDRITAIYELVKNCYDADATSVDLEFYNIQTRNPKSVIIIRDNGQGMSLDDITNKWLVVGTGSKRTNKYSPKFKRRYIGEKGVGRFATDKLGEHLRIRTKQAKDPQILEVTINWKKYEEEMKTTNVQQLLFTDLENEYRYIENDDTFPTGNGTELRITLLHEAWDEQMILRLHNQLTRILSPFNKPNPPFDIYFYAPDFGMPKEQVKAEPIESLATKHVIIPFDATKNLQGKLSFNITTQDFDITYTAPEIFGLISLQFYYFNTAEQATFKAKYKGTENKVEGVKIYRDGVICTPFAEYESRIDNRRDILGIDKRRYTEAFNKLSSREIIGIVEITNEGNPKIKDATSRQDFDDTPEYRRLKEFIIEQIDILAEYKFVKREEKKAVIQNNLKRATADVKEIEQTLRNIAKDRPELIELLTPTIDQAKKAADFVKEGVKDKEEEKKEFQRKENLYLSLMSIQELALELVHDIRFQLAPIKHIAEDLIDNYSEAQIQEDAKKIFTHANKITAITDFMLSYSKIEIEATFTIKDFLENILQYSYEITLEREQIEVQIEITDNIELTGIKKFLEDVFSNLISNSIKALKNTTHKKIKCEVFAETNLTILFSDNGSGVPEAIKETLFNLFVTSTAEQGGAGLGLYIARNRMHALNGTIELTNSIYNPIGTTFKIVLPLKNKK